MILVKKLKFFHLLCLAKIHRENVCAYVLDIKEAFKDYKNNCDYKKHHIRIFPKGLVHRFDQKFEISSTLILMQNRLRKSIWESSS